MMRARKLPVPQIVLTMLLAAGLAAAPRGAAAVGAYRVVDVTNGGALTGTVTLSGVPDLRHEVAVSSDHDVCGDQIADPSAAISPEGRLAGAFVYLEDIAAGKPFAPGPATLDNQHCKYVPYVQGAAAGGEIELINSDSALHNVHVNIGVRTLWNIALPLQGFSVNKTLPDRTGILSIGCDVHEWMKATIHLMEHPYFATTDADGLFQIGDVPPGTYTLVTWHERFGEARRQVTVAAGADADVAVVLDVE